MKKNLFFLLLINSFSLFSQTNCSDFKLSDFKINGSTTITNNEATLTRAIVDQGGSIWSNQKIDLSKDFKISTELNFGTIDGGGADGIAFVLQPLSSDLGNTGGGLGYQGISPSLAIEFDTWFNTSMDPVTQDHIAIIKNGRTDNMSAHSEFTPSIVLPNIEDGLWHEGIFEWDANTKKLKLTFDNIVQFEITIDIANSIFSGNNIVYWGFTAATGSAVNIQKVKLKNYCVTLETCANIPEITSSNTSICANQSVQLGIEYTPPTICNMNITPSSIPLGNPIPGFTYGGFYNGHYYYIYNTPTTWTAGELISRQNGGYLVCINDINENQFVSNLTNNNIWIGLFRDPTTCQFRWLDCMDITFTNWRPGEPNSAPCGEPYTQIIRGCSYGLNTWNNLNDISSNGSCYSDMVPIMEIDPAIYNLSPINSTTTYLWSTGETTSAISPTPLVTTTYWVDVTTNGITCRKSITINVKNTPAPTGVAKQQFCNDNTIDALAVNGTAIKWYESATGSTALNNNYALANETNYYATQTIDGCESINRFQTTVSIQKVPTPTGDSIQRFCLEDTPNITKLNVTGTNINWMDTPINGTLINNSSLLQDDTTYYAKSIDTVTGCESIQRLAVTVDLFRCNIIAYNLVSINGDPLNDKLTFEDISYFPDNSLKIYNRYGKLVWETTGYNNTNNAFKGKANVSGVYMNDSSLPAGTYFYILKTVDENGKVQDYKGFIQVVKESIK
jgi:gliding motility-associated-like protein